MGILNLLFTQLVSEPVCLSECEHFAALSALSAGLVVSKAILAIMLKLKPKPLNKM